MSQPSASSISVSSDGKSYVTSGGIGGTFSGSAGYFLRRPTGANGFGAYSTSDQVLANWDGTGKVAIVTGSAGGLGFETARALASKGAEVIVTARDQAKAEAAAEKLRALLPGGAKLTPMAVDLSDLASVHAFAQAFLATRKPLNILINNAGIMALPKYGATKDGIEQQLGVNHCGHFALTNLLLPHIIASAKSSGVEGRIVSVASSAHHMAYPEGVLLDKYNDESRYTHWGAYGRSKLANILFARELALRLAKAKANVVAYSLHPGCIVTDLQRSLSSIENFAVTRVMALFFKSVPQGAATQLVAATAPAGWAPSGEYLADCNICGSSAHAHNAELGTGLWALSEKLTGVKGAI